MILVKEDHCAMCGTKFAGQYEYDFQVCSVCDPIPTIEEIEQSSFSTAQVAAMAKRIAELEAKVEQLEAENALMKKKAHVSFGCFWNGGWYSNVGTEGHIDHSPTPPAEGDGNE